jgi:hypothetical protein
VLDSREQRSRLCQRLSGESPKTTSPMVFCWCKTIYPQGFGAHFFQLTSLLHRSRVINTANWVFRINWVAHNSIIQLREQNGYPPFSNIKNMENILHIVVTGGNRKPSLTLYILRSTHNQLFIRIWETNPKKLS